MLKARLYKLFCLLTIIGGGYAWLVYATLHPPLPCLEKPLIFYSSQTRDDLKRVILSAIDKATHSISLQIYGLTDPDIIALLLKKKEAGVKVSLFYDKSASKNLPKALEATPIKTKGLMHRKILVIDNYTSYIGSANFTIQSLKMHGNLLVGLHSPPIAKALSDKTGFLYQGCEGYFLPEKGPEALERLCQVMAQAQKKIEVAIFTLTHPLIIEALIQAHNRGVAITLCADRYTGQGASAKALAQLEQAGIQVLHSQGDQLLHYKGALIDGHTLVFGSANWTLAAFEKNHDAIWIFDNLPLSETQKLQKLFRTIEKSCALR